ncbi:MAG: adenylate/guanylate cyclase domain-containing protein, partial [Acidobacteriota bacterium]
ARFAARAPISLEPIGSFSNAKRLDPLITVILLAPAGEPIDRLETYRNGAFDCLMAGKQRGAEAWREVAVKAGLALDFRRLSLDQIADRERISTLSRAFDPRLLQLLDEDPPALGVRMRRATIVFADIRGYSKLCDRLTAQPDVLQGFLFDYYSTASDAVFKHGGILDKFLGDVVMAIFCDDLIGDDRTGAGPAAAAALRMEDHFERVLRKWRVQWGGAGALKLGLACAIHSGECLVGNLGTTDREQFTAIGPHVNFAAQLRGLAKGGQIVVSEDAGRTLPPSYRLETLGTLEKIKSLPGRSIPVYRLRGRG